MKLTESLNGTTVEIVQEKGKCVISIYGTRKPETVKAVNQLQYSILPASWVMRQILRTI